MSQWMQQVSGMQEKQLDSCYLRAAHYVENY